MWKPWGSKPFLLIITWVEQQFHDFIEVIEYKRHVTVLVQSLLIKEKSACHYNVLYMFMEIYMYIKPIYRNILV